MIYELSMYISLFQISWGTFVPKILQNRMKFDKDITKIKRVAFFETQCIC